LSWPGGIEVFLELACFFPRYLWCFSLILSAVNNMLTIFIIALGLAMDAFAVAITVGYVLPRFSYRAVFRLSWHFGLFQFLMPILGWAAGLTVNQWIMSYDHWIAFGLLGFIGGKMIYESFQFKSVKNRTDPTRGWNLIILSVATSIDALAIGLSMAVLGVRVWQPSAIIGVVAATMTVAGMYLGRTMGQHLGHRMEFIGGIILIGIGVKILIEHLA